MEDFESLLIKYENEIKENLKKEHLDVQYYYIDEYETLNADQFDDVLKLQKEENTTLPNAIRQTLEEYDVFLDQRREMAREIKDSVLDFINKKEDTDFDYDILSDGELDTLEEFAYANLNDQFHEKDLLDLIGNFREITVTIEPREYIEDSYLDLRKYNDYNGELQSDYLSVENIEKIKEQLTDPNKIDIINWLVQTQGYEIADLYDDKKVEQSKFLQSLKKELWDYCDEIEGMNLVVSCINADFDSFLAVNEDKNLIISPNKKAYIGLVNETNGSGSGLEIQLEKELIIPKEWKHVECYKNKGSDYSVDGIFGLIDSDPDVFITTEKEAITPKPMNINSLLEKAEKFDENRKQMKEVVKKIESEYGISAYSSYTNNPSLIVELNKKIKESFEIGNEILKKYDLDKIETTNNKTYEDLTIQKNGKVLFTTYDKIFIPEKIQDAIEVSKKTKEDFSYYFLKTKLELLFNDNKLDIKSKEIENISTDKIINALKNNVKEISINGEKKVVDGKEISSLKKEKTNLNR